VATGFLISKLKKKLFRPAVVCEVQPLSGHFRFVKLFGEGMKGALWSRGQKVQFHLGGMLFRTHTPVIWDAHSGFAAFVFFLHGKGPGSAWAASLKKGDLCQLSTPKTCLDFPAMKGPTIFFGDETSIGAARALGSSAYAEQEHQYIFEVSSSVSFEEVLHYFRLPNTTLIQKTPGNTHLAEAERILLIHAQCCEAPRCVFSGCAQSIRQLRSRLRLHGAPLADMIVKPYWAEGKAGLD